MQGRKNTSNQCRGGHMAGLSAATLLLVLLAPAAPLGAEESALGLRFISASGHRSLTAGEESVFHLEVKNKSDQAVTDIRFSSRTPEDWQLSLAPEVLPSLEPGKKSEVKIAITAPKRADEGYYTVWLYAHSEAADETLSVSLRVETPPGRWLAVALILAGALLAAFVVVFLRLSGRE
jgi:uncharacterized membrane protein